MMLTQLALLMAGLAGTGPTDKRDGDLNRAAALYHEAKYDSAYGDLVGLLADGNWKRRDSLVLYQYLGMTCARLGRDSLAAEYFAGLIGVDSLFRFARNEDPVMLDAFQRGKLFASGKRGKSPIPLSDAASGSRPEAAAAGPAQLTPTASLFATPAPTPGDAALHEARMNLAYGAIPFGAGWMARNRMKRGVTVGFIQLAALVVSGYASEMQNREQQDLDGLGSGKQLSAAQNWQWIQRISLSVAVGGYLYSIISSGGE